MAPVIRHPAPDPEACTSYFVVCGEDYCYVVSPAMVRHIEAALARWLPPRWVTFVDLSGARVRVRSASIRQVYQSTAAQRAFDRAHRRAVQREGKDEEPFEE